MNISRTRFIDPMVNFAFKKIFATEPNKNLLHDICLCNRETGEIFYDKLGYTYIELAKFVKSGNELDTLLEDWLYALKH